MNEKKLKQNNNGIITGQGFPFSIQLSVITYQKLSTRIIHHWVVLIAPAHDEFKENVKTVHNSHHFTREILTNVQCESISDQSSLLR